MDTRSTKITFEWPGYEFKLIQYNEMFLAVKWKENPITKTIWRRSQGKLNSCNLLGEL